MNLRNFKQRVVLMVAFCMILTVPLAASARKSSHEFGDVAMNRYTQKGQLPVTFRHWVHRSKHSCRLCHVDLEFGMVAGATDITEADNKAGRYCGACHNGKEAFAIAECEKCHLKDVKSMREKDRQMKAAFYKYKANLPKSIYGNKIDWTIAEEMGLVKAKDFIKGVTFPNKDRRMANLRDEPQTPKLKGLPGIIFSHKKHVAWTGCGMCHPEQFALETGKTDMTMKEISNKKFCGICHTSVAFPLNDCSKCHSGEIQK